MDAIESRSTCTSTATRCGSEGQIYKSERELQDENKDKGLLESSRRFLLGKRASKWLHNNESDAFALADTCLQAAARAQSALQAILDAADRGEYPKVTVMREGEYVEEDMSPLNFAKTVTALTVECMTAVDKALTIRNK